MFDTFEGNMIDVSGISIIINKLELYIDNEEKIIEEIVNTLNKLSSDYKSDNNDVYIDEKRNNLISSLYKVLDNKKKMTEYLRKVIYKYRTIDNNVNLYYGIN